MRQLEIFLIATAVLCCSARPGRAAGTAPAWMWGEGERQAAGAAEMRRKFSLDPVPDGEVLLRALGDFCRLEIWLNGQRLARRDAFDPGLQVSVKRWLRAGENQIVVKAIGVAGPSAVALDLVGEDGVAMVVSGDGWQGGRAIAPLGSLRLGDAGLPPITPLDEYNQWKESGSGDGAARFSPLPDGFKLERVRAAGADEGSWISMAFDPQGRLVISKEKRGLLRLDLPGGGGLETIDDSLLECRGLLFAHGALYANANNSKALYRLRDADGDGRFEEVERLIDTAGGVGHGRNDLSLGPDGMIYSIHGDSVQLPAEIRRTLPVFPGASGEQGFLMRCDAQGGRRELVSVGLRNPYGIAFNRDGEAFTYDADNEGDIGLPLYRPARVNHLVSGANFGWQQARGESWPVYYPESLPTTFDAGRGSPTAVEFGTRSHFPPRYQQALFVLDWAYGRIIALEVIPHGASYRCHAETFLRGRPLNVTDLAFGPDGAMYLITGGRGTQSALYRVSYVGAKVAPPEQTSQERAREEFSKAARALRRSLEEGHGRRAPALLERAWPHLNSPDPWVRNAARAALEAQPPEAWAERVLAERNLVGLLVLARSGRDVAASARTFDFGTLSRADKLTVLRLLELGPGSDPAADRTYLAPLFPDGDPPVDRELSKLLARLGDPGVVAKSLAILAATDSQPERLHYLDVLSRVAGGWPLDGRRAFFSAIRHPDYFRGDRNLPGFIQGLRERALATLADGERAALGELVHAASDPPPLPEARALLKHWEIGDLVPPPEPGFRPDPQLGRRVFEQALCSRCHQVGGIGTPVGPNLSAVAGRFSRRDLAVAIVEPSRAMAEAFRNLIIELRDGSTVVGRVVRDDFRESTISIAPDPFAPTELTVIAKGDIVSHRPSPASPMPPGLLDSFTLDEVHQLFAFLERGGGAE